MKKYVTPIIEIDSVTTEDIMSASTIVSVTQDGDTTNAGASLGDMINKFLNDNL